MPLTKQQKTESLDEVQKLLSTLRESLDDLKRGRLVGHKEAKKRLTELSNSR